jgi:hypothetical protein
MPREAKAKNEALRPSTPSKRGERTAPTPKEKWSAWSQGLREGVRKEGREGSGK